MSIDCTKVPKIKTLGGVTYNVTGFVLVYGRDENITFSYNIDGTVEYTRKKLHWINVQKNNIDTEIIIVSKKEGEGDYSTISDAVNNAVSGSTIIVMPGEYNEYVNCGSKELSIIGIDKTKCILWNDLGDYDKCPLWMTFGYLKNMTIKTIKADGKQGSNIPYCVHIDINFYPPSSQVYDRKIVIEDCDFYSDWSDCLGCGIAPNDYEIVVKNCKLVNTNKSGRYPFAIHPAATTSNTDLYLIGNQFINGGSGNKVVQFNTNDNYPQSTISCKAYNNMLYSVVNGVSDLNVGDLTRQVSLDVTSYGNNTSKLNYDNLLNN